MVNALGVIALELPLARHGATVLLNLAVVIAVGASVALLWTTQATSAWARGQGRALRRASLAALAVALLASAGVL